MVQTLRICREAVIDASGNRPGDIDLRKIGEDPLASIEGTQNTPVGSPQRFDNTLASQYQYGISKRQNLIVFSVQELEAPEHLKMQLQWKY